MLQNAYFLAKIGADTAKNEGKFAEILPIGRRVAACGRRGLPHLRADFEHLRGADRHGGQHADLGNKLVRPGLGLARLAKMAKLAFQNFCKILQNFLASSFSALSKRNFARKYAFDSIFQSLQDLQFCILLHRCDLKIFAKKSV